MRKWGEFTWLEKEAVFFWVFTCVLGLALPWFALRKGDVVATSSLHGYQGPGWILAALGAVAVISMLATPTRTRLSSFVGLVAGFCAIALPFLVQSYLSGTGRYATVIIDLGSAAAIVGGLWLVLIQVRIIWHGRPRVDHAS